MQIEQLKVFNTYANYLQYIKFIYRVHIKFNDFSRSSVFSVDDYVFYYIWVVKYDFY